MSLLAKVAKDRKEKGKPNLIRKLERYGKFEFEWERWRTIGNLKLRGKVEKHKKNGRVY